MPAAFVLLDALPLSPNGKIDRRALPAPDGSRPELARQYVAPRTPAEELLAGIYGEVLGLERVGIHDNFFELGGDSILSIQVVSRARARGLHVTPLALFQNPAVAALALLAQQAGRAIRAEQGELSGPLGLGPIARWFLEDRPATPSTSTSRCCWRWGRRWRSRCSAPRWRRCCGITTPCGCGWSTARPVPVPTPGRPPMRQSCRPTSSPGTTCGPCRRPSSGRRSSVWPRRRRPVSTCGRAPLVRAAYFDLGPQSPGRLLLVIHHLAVDGVSWRILLEDLLLAYRLQQEGRPIRLPAKTSSLRQWTARLAEYAHEPALAEQASYWLDVARPPRRWPVPLDRPEGENTVALRQSLHTRLSAPLTEFLLREVPAVYHTQIHEVLVAALADAVRRWTGSSGASRPGRARPRRTVRRPRSYRALRVGSRGLRPERRWGLGLEHEWHRRRHQRAFGDRHHLPAFFRQYCGFQVTGLPLLSVSNNQTTGILSFGGALTTAP